MSEQVKNKGWTVTFAGMGVNLALGVLYAWSVLKAAIEAEVNRGNWNWDKASLNDPYAVAMIVFAIAMVPAGRLLDRFGPRLVSSIGGVLVCAGFLIAALSTNIWAWILGFGVLAGTGIGFSYASGTPAAVKWFPARRTGLIAGIVVAGFGLASAYIAPLAKWMQGTFGITSTMLYLGIAFGAVVVLLSQLMQFPPAGYVPAGAAPAPGAKAPAVSRDYTWREMISTPTFWILWFVYVIGAGAGLMVIGFANGMATAAFKEVAWIAVALLAVGNALGRVAAGVLSDRIGRTATLIIVLLFQAVLMFSLLVVPPTSGILVLIVATFLGFNYGANLTLFPAATKDYFGLKSFGLNYGIMFTAWGVGGAVLSRISQTMVANTGKLHSSAIMAGSLLVLGALLTLFVKAPKAKEPVAKSAAPEPVKSQA